jgi:hypothetical protein
MHEHDVGFTAPAGIERLARPLRQDFHSDTGLLREERQQVVEQAGIPRRSSRGDDNRFFLRQRMRRQENGDAKGGDESDYNFSDQKRIPP